MKHKARKTKQHQKPKGGLTDDMKYDILFNGWAKNIADQMANPKVKG